MFSATVSKTYIPIVFHFVCVFVSVFASSMSMPPTLWTRYGKALKSCLKTGSVCLNFYWRSLFKERRVRLTPTKAHTDLLLSFNPRVGFMYNITEENQLQELMQ